MLHIYANLLHLLLKTSNTTDYLQIVKSNLIEKKNEAYVDFTNYTILQQRLSQSQYNSDKVEICE